MILSLSSAKLRDGNDGAYVRGTTFAQVSPIDGGTGANEIDQEVILAWDFSRGLQRWGPGYVGRSPALDGQPITELEWAEQVGGEFGLRPMPEETGLEGSGFAIIEDNGNPFIARPVNSDLGVLAGQQYSVKYEMVVAVGPQSTNPDRDFIYVGALPTTPNIDSARTISDDKSQLYLVVDDVEYRLVSAGTGNHSVNPLTPPVFPSEFALVGRGNPDMLASATANKDGKLWLVVFLSGGGELFSTNPSNIFRTIQVTLTPL
ncbi:MAG: hypothetical protein KatS3mg082_3155 [Nitrospiraceae bacterium]|nr:MAG: hypothetical protein KatS3mg082_3155 [Nitrospiraceae bacterium]